MMAKIKGKVWYRSKTIWASIAGIVAALGGYLTGEMDLQVALPAAITALSIIFMRIGLQDQQ